MSVLITILLAWVALSIFCAALFCVLKRGTRRLDAQPPPRAQARWHLNRITKRHPWIAWIIAALVVLAWLALNAQTSEPEPPAAPAHTLRPGLNV